MDYEGEEMLNGRMISYIKAEDWIEKMLKEYGFHKVAKQPSEMHAYKPINSPKIYKAISLINHKN
jgi:hypothetical protein